MQNESKASFELRVVTCEEGNSGLMITDSNTGKTFPIEPEGVQGYFDSFGEVDIKLVKNKEKIKEKEVETQEK